jgi:ABC-type polysaccharide/polyol phosphate transport system ATPase subunit
MSNSVIDFEHVSKEYRLGAIGGGTLRGDLQSLWARVTGKEDPNAKLGQVGTRNERFLALNDVSFKVSQGDKLGIIGHNGAGKSTLLKLLSRVTRPTTGEIAYSGRIASMLEVGTGFHPELTGRENVYMNGAILGMTKAEVTKKFDEIVSFAEMERFIDTPVKRYSSGMYVKLAFAVAAHLDSEILVMDEVLAVGDMKFQQKCLGKMGDVADKEGRTVLYVSHNMNTIRRLCNRSIVLERGNIVWDGSTESAIEHYMDNNIPLSTYVDLSSRPREERATKAVTINSITIINNENTCEIKQSEPLVFKLNFKCIRKTSNVYLRATVSYSDDTIVGMTNTKNIMNFDVRDNIEKTFTLNCSLLAPGKYHLRLVLYRVNEFGNQEFTDIIGNACSFTKADGLENNNIEWDHRWWGHTNFDKMEIVYE